MFYNILFLDELVKDGWSFIRPKDQDAVYKALKINPADLYRNGLTDLRKWKPINLENGILNEGIDYFLNKLDVKKYWKENLKIKETEIVRKEIEKEYSSVSGTESSAEAEMIFPESSQKNVLRNVIQTSGNILSANSRIGLPSILKKRIRNKKSNVSSLLENGKQDF